MPDFHLDLETTSLCDIALGSYRYGADPSTRILLMAVAKEDGEPVVWRFNEPNHPESIAAVELLEEAIPPGDRIYAHNAGFEIALLHYRLAQDVQPLFSPELHQWRCTQAMCRKAAIPESLGGAAEFLNLPTKKDGIGKALIHVFSDQTKVVTLEPPVGAIDPSTQKLLKNGSLSKGAKPKNRKSKSPILDEEVLWDWRVKVAGEWITVRDAWNLFIEYCRQDVKVERELHKKLSRFELSGDELASFQFDLRMNHSGVPVNVSALRNAQAIIEKFQEKVEARMFAMCGLRSGQREKLLKWLGERGYPHDNLQSDTVETTLDEGVMTGLGLEVLRCRFLLSFAAIKKIPTMLASVCPDGRIRGTMVWHGARTGRATGRIAQVHNVKKSTIPDSQVAYGLICDAAEVEVFEGLWESPLEAIASCVRHFIQFEDSMMQDADFVGVEARITPWLAGEQSRLDSILEGVDQYKDMASRLFKIDYEDVEKWQRTIAKPVVLGCCFGVGGKGLMEALAKPPYNVTRTRAECEEYVSIYRETSPATVAAWKEIEEAAKAAIRQQGGVHRACDNKLAFTMIRTAGTPFLVMRLPSSRRMYYPLPEIKAVFKKYDEEDMLENPWKREKGGYWIDSISFYGKHEGRWCRIHTWGSRLFENAVQATGADLLHHGCISAEARGYEIAMIVHDQALARDNGLPLEGFVNALCTKQPWAESFPLAASGLTVPFYLKDD